MKKKWTLLLIGCFLLIGIALGVFLNYHVWAAGRFVPRSSVELDMRGEKLSVADFEKLREEIPECKITWDVPFQDSYCDSSTQTIQVSSLTEEDVLILDYLQDLTWLDAAQCTDYDALLAFQARRPECRVTYQVTLGGDVYPNDVTALHIENPSAEELEEKLNFLLEVSEVHLSGQLPDVIEIQNLQDAFPEISFRWDVPFGDTILDSTARELDFSEKCIDYSDAVALLRWFPALEKVNMRGCGLTDEEMMALAQRYPQCFFLWDMQIGEVTVSTDAEEIDISGQILQSTEEVEELLPYFPNLKKVIMCKCGLDDETMDALNKRYEDIRFVWSVRIRYVYVRTDATYFYPFKFDRDMTVDSDDLYPLRYCTDMVCIDVGHMWGVKDCEWAAFMPNLKYLILGETSVSDLTPLSNCKNLAFLELFTIPVTDYSPLLGCTGLEDLNLGKTYGDPAPIAQMTWLNNLWWSGVAGTHGLPCSDAPDWLPEALPDTVVRFNLEHPTADGWRKLENYYGMRDFMGMFYLD